MKTCFEFVTDEGNRWQRVIDGHIPVFHGMYVKLSDECEFELIIDTITFVMKNQTIHACDTDEFYDCYINKYRQTLLDNGWTEISPQ